MLDQFDDLCAKDAVRFVHDVDDYSFDDSVNFSIENVLLTNWSRTFIVTIPSPMDRNRSDMLG